VVGYSPLAAWRLTFIKGSPHWDNNFCKAGEEETAEKASNARAVPIPDCDPIFGFGGPLVEIWCEAAKGSRPAADFDSLISA